MLSPLPGLAGIDLDFPGLAPWATLSRPSGADRDGPFRRETLPSSFQIAMIVFFPISFWVFRYSRVIWLHLDQLIDPRPKSQDI